MATVSKSKRKANPQLTKNGKTRLKPLSRSRLEELLSKTSRPREKDKIQRRLNSLPS